MSKEKDSRERKIKVLFLCTHNSARSQMAEGLLREMGGERFEVKSAGTEPSFVHPIAIESMNEIGIDISEQGSKSVLRFKDEPFDVVVTVCDRAKEQCSVFHKAGQMLHWSLPDPASDSFSAADQREAFRKVRDRLKVLIEETFCRDSIVG